MNFCQQRTAPSPRGAAPYGKFAIAAESARSSRRKSKLEGACLTQGSTRPVQPAGFFFAAKPDKGRTGMEGAGDPVEAIEPPVCGGTPMKTPAPTHLHPNQGAAVTQGSPLVNQSKPRAPMADTAAECISESPQGHRAV